MPVHPESVMVPPRAAGENPVQPGSARVSAAGEHVVGQAMLGWAQPDGAEALERGVRLPDHDGLHVLTAEPLAGHRRDVLDGDRGDALRELVERVVGQFVERELCGGPTVSKPRA
jgi:hypothetical protein